jgi:hypothetical protein
MLLHDVVHINDTISLLVILGVLGGGVIVSMVMPAVEPSPESDDAKGDIEAKNAHGDTTGETAGAAARTTSSVDVSSSS